MCVRKIEIYMKKPEENQLWKMPKQVLEIINKGGNPKMLAKCGKCHECRAERARNWTYKIWLESFNHKEKCFITLTYKDNEKGKEVNKRDVQNFIKRLRKKYPNNNIKYYAAGEYGETKGRAHYHIIILGYMPKDLKIIRNYKSKSKINMYRSKEVKKLWQNQGIVTVQTFGYKSIDYSSLYINKNEYISNHINYKELKEYKIKMQALQLKYGILKKHIDHKGQTRYYKIKNIKDLDKKQHKKYKLEQQEIKKSIKLKKNPEFNLASKGMGFDTCLNKKYYKYDLIIDNFKYEIPKEYLRKVYDNMENYNQEIVSNVINHMLKRKEYAENEYIDLTLKEAIIGEKIKEKEQKNKHFNTVKLTQNNPNLKSIY